MHLSKPTLPGSAHSIKKGNSKDAKGSSIGTEGIFCVRIFSILHPTVCDLHLCKCAFSGRGSLNGFELLSHRIITTRKEFFERFFLFGSYLCNRRNVCPAHEKKVAMRVSPNLDVNFHNLFNTKKIRCMQMCLVLAPNGNSLPKVVPSRASLRPAGALNCFFASVHLAPNLCNNFFALFCIKLFPRHN